MIPLRRGAVPEQLRAWLAERAGRLRELISRGEDPPKSLLDSYRYPPLKEYLIAEACGKCAYCESKITHVYFGDIEHMKPKSAFLSESLDLENLTLACACCNNAKGDFWEANTRLLNPYQDDPSQELFAFGFMIAHRAGRDRARLTIAKLDLNRPALLERRKERVELLQGLADQYVQTPNGPIKDLLRTELRRHAADDGEYAMIVRTYLEAACELRHEPTV